MRPRTLLFFIWTSFDSDMDQQRRLLVFTVLSFLILVGWMSVGPKLFPGLFPQPPKPVKKPEVAKEKPADAADMQEADANKADQPDAVATVEAKLPNHATQSVVLGSGDPRTGYGLKVTLSSVGAGIVAAELNDPRYKALKPRQPGGPVPQLSLLGNDLPELKPLAPAPPVTGHLAIEEIDRSLRKLDPNASLARLNWDVIAEDVEPDGVTKRSVTFGVKTPDGQWQLRKTYEVRRWEKPDANRDEDPAGYQIAMLLSFKNLSSKDQTVVYDLQGPAGLPLENAENASKFRDVKFGFREQDGDLITNSLATRDIVRAFDAQLKDKNKKVEELKAGDRTFQYVGLDTQYFAALVMPQDAAKNQASYLDLARPQLVRRVAERRFLSFVFGEETGKSDVSVLLRSVEHTVPAEGEITHEYRLYLGPKRAALLAPLRAEKVIEFSGFLFIPASLVAGIANLLLWILASFHRIGIPYGLCVMLLTVLVRSCLFPISRKQAINAKRMKEIQPRLAELKTKYGNDKQKFAEEQMKLFAETGFNPLGGCLPVFLQLPIFLGLYQSLNTSVDLRGVPFLWFSNLAAPDALFTLPFALPFLGNEFNLLPILTTALFLFQQKMFMPPPTDEQTRMQAKMFFWMTLMMGFLFYHVPAGLCVYFIASSLWSMGERKLLDRVVPTPPPSTEAKKKNSGSEKPANSFWSRLRERLEELGEMEGAAGVRNDPRPRDRPKDKRKSRP